MGDLRAVGDLRERPAYANNETAYDDSAEGPALVKFASLPLRDASNPPTPCDRRFGFLSSLRFPQRLIRQKRRIASRGAIPKMDVDTSSIISVVIPAFNERVMILQITASQL